MKLRTKIILAVVALMSLLAVAGFAAHNSFGQDGQDGQKGQRRFGQRGPGRGFGGPGQFGMLPLRALDLTDAQKEQVKAIHDAEKTKVEPFVTQLREAHKAMREATASGKFDEATVREIAAKQAQAQTELAVSHARVQAAIYQVLTPEQRTKLETFRAERKGRRGGERQAKQGQ